MSLLRRLVGRDEVRQQFGPMSLPAYFEMYQTFGPQLLMSSDKSKAIDPSFLSYAQRIYAAHPTAFACIAVRLLIFAQARLVWRRWENGRPQAPWTDTDLEMYEKPWTKGTTGTLLGGMLLDSDLAGTALVARRRSGLRRLRPDRVSVVLGTDEDLATLDVIAGEVDWSEIDTEVVGYLYHPGGYDSGKDPLPLLADEVASFAPIPDAGERWRGMSWLTPLLNEIRVDQAATKHRLAFFDNNGTDQAVVKLDLTDPQKFKEWVALFKEQHEGVLNAWKNYYLGAGADMNVIGTNFRDMDLRSLSGLSETRIAAAAGVPPAISGLSEGLQGSSLNAGNYSAARRRFAEGTLVPLWEAACAALDQISTAPDDGRELWYAHREILFLQEDAADDADIRRRDAIAMRQLVEAGYDPQSVVAATVANDFSLLVHTGRVSVQLQPIDADPDPDDDPDDDPDAEE